MTPETLCHLMWVNRLSSGQIAAALGLSNRSHVSRWRTGERPIPRYHLKGWKRSSLAGERFPKHRGPKLGIRGAAASLCAAFDVPRARALPYDQGFGRRGLHRLLIRLRSGRNLLRLKGRSPLPAPTW
jgi:hypothetical protein